MDMFAQYWIWSPHLNCVNCDRVHYVANREPSYLSLLFQLYCVYGILK